MKPIGQRIKELRLNKNLSQKDIANKLGVVPATISSWETGNSEPGLDNLNKLSLILETSIEDLASTNVPFHPVANFGLNKGCDMCLEKDFIIQLLREQIEELKDHIKTLKGI